jgi:hypothetical protein
LVGERRGVASAYGGKERSAIESELQSFGEDVLFCNTLDVISLSGFSPVNCSTYRAVFSGSGRSTAGRMRRRWRWFAGGGEETVNFFTNWVDWCFAAA